MPHPIHHQHERKRIFRNLEEFPHTDKTKAFFDKVVYIFGILIPVLTLPQAFVIWFSRSAADVSLITWIAYFVNGLVWLTYGLLHRERPIIFTWVLMSMINLSVVVGIILYG